MHGIWNVRESIISEKFRGLRKICSLGVKKLFEFGLLTFEFSFLDVRWLREASFVVGVHNVDYEVDVEIEF